MVNYCIISTKMHAVHIFLEVREVHDFLDPLHAHEYMCMYIKIILVAGISITVQTSHSRQFKQDMVLSEYIHQTKDTFSLEGG